MNTSPFIIRSRGVVTPEGLCECAILIEDGAVRDILSVTNLPRNFPVEDFRDAVVMPGLVDTHVHINEPGRTAWEGFESATKGAAAGGITTLVEMPLNSRPVTSNVPAFRQKLDATRGKLWVDCGFYGGIIPGNTSDIEPLIDAGVLGFKAFLIHSGIDDFPNVTGDDLRQAMPIIAQHGLPLLVHCELQGGADIPTFHSNPKRYDDYLASRPAQWEQDAVELMIGFCKTYDCPTHIVHLSSSRSIPMLRQARNEGVPISVETCPHYLYFVAEEIRDGDTRFKCAPPIHKKGNRERLWDGLRNGDIDLIVSDHSPSTPDLKCLDAGDFQKAWGGIASLQLGLSVVWTEAQRRGFSIEEVSRWMSHRPARLVGLERRKGVIAAGYDADIVVWNPDVSYVVDQSMIHHRHKLTPYEGKTLRGVVERTYLRGEKVYDRRNFSSHPHGRVLLREPGQAWNKTKIEHRQG